jgi:hypothetical protein
MQVRLQVDASLLASQMPELFSDLFIQRRVPWQTISGSMAAHAAVLLAVVLLPRILSPEPPPKPPIVRVMRYLSLRAENPMAGFSGQARLVLPAMNGPARGPSPAPAGERAGGGYLVRLIEARRLASARDTLIQPDLPTVEVAPELRVPALIAMSSAPLKPPPRRFVRPPETVRPNAPSNVILEIAPPQFQAASVEVPSGPLRAPAIPSLTAPPQARALVAGVFMSPPVAEFATTAGPGSGQGVNLISLPERSIPAPSEIAVPPGNQVSTLGPGFGPGSRTGSGGTGRGAAAAGAVESGTGGSGEGAGGGLARGSSPREVPPPTDAPPLRIERSQSGNYEVVVVQSRSAVPGTAGFLSGRPVYTVYLNVGFAKEWILEFCLPHGADAPHSAQRGAVVQLGASSAPLTAPYAYVLVRPSIAFKPGATYAFVHGLVNSLGRLEQLSEVGAPSLEDSSKVVAVLSGWEFRPATRDGVATAVEILLCIPAVFTRASGVAAGGL